MALRACKRLRAWAGERHLVASGAKLLEGCHAGDKGLIIEEGVCTAQQGCFHSCISIHRPHKDFCSRRELMQWPQDIRTVTPVVR